MSFQFTKKEGLKNSVQAVKKILFKIRFKTKMYVEDEYYHIGCFTYGEWEFQIDYGVMVKLSMIYQCWHLENCSSSKHYSKVWCWRRDRGLSFASTSQKWRIYLGYRVLVTMHTGHNSYTPTTKIHTEK